ncbi:MAG: 2-hydroxy-3-oxopropionate reductase (EC [uncultured Thiotrichaceae bacterium]|uniref:2-hydroxy-3-oxopropionate reductase (EC) n=1 Tax=uncultured Thiotrichaceae bacterium TaxID=298394 RepID=A0A6S6UKF9_9GAMM|nr:MAG: 2-hydroxy-3-oxopropionate reductase (EC [uncultured Thiotrichaceae bacterium]
MQKNKTTVSFLGLGTMGFPMAGHLANAGFEVMVYNRTESVADRWLQTYQGVKALTPAEAAKNAEFVITCVGNDDDVLNIFSGETGIFSTLPDGGICMDHTTTSATLAEDMAGFAKELGHQFLDAPVSGGQAGAEQGILTVMVGGDADAYEKAEPVMQAYAKSVKRIGEAGFGQRCKMVNQICAAGVIQGLAEGLALAQKSGIDADTVLGALQHGAASSWQMVNRTQTMMNDEFDFGFAVDWMRKDLGICLEEAEKLGLELPMTKGVDDAYALLQKAGHQRSDTSVLIKQFDLFDKENDVS